jgi:hypothetical protein
MSGRRYEAVLTALILTAAISIPSASQNIDYGSEKPSTPIIHSASTQDIDVSTSSNIPTTAEIEEEDALYRLSETPHKSIETVSTPAAVLRLKVDNDSRIYELETANGELVTGMKNGREIYEFTGANRSIAEEKMSEMREDLRDYQQEIREEMTPELEIKVTKSKSDDPDERVVVENEETDAVELDGWTLMNSDSDIHEFDDMELDSGQRVYVYKAAESELNVSELSEPEYIYGTGLDWDYYSDHASLFNQDGVLIAEDSY